MITFEAFSERLARGQLKNTAAVEDTNLGEICPIYIDTILNLTNQGLVDISTRIPLIKKKIDLVFVPGQNLYEFLDSNIGGYLDVTQTEPFSEDSFIKVIELYSSSGRKYLPNTEGHITSPKYNNLYFTSSIVENLSPKVRVYYQAKHPTIDISSNIDIPPNLVTALQLFVSSLYISHMNGEDHMKKGDKYFAAYLRHLGEDDLKDLSSVSEIDSDTRFTDRGFV